VPSIAISLTFCPEKIRWEHRPHLWRDLEEPVVEEIGGLRRDRRNRFEAGLHEGDLLWRHESSIERFRLR
jgi:hypothetical protein